MAGNRPAGGSGNKIAGSSSQQTNPQLDPQQTFALLQEFAKQHISTKIEEMQPEIDKKIASLVEDAKAAVVKEITDSKSELQHVRNSVLGAIAVILTRRHRSRALIGAGCLVDQGTGDLQPRYRAYRRWPTTKLLSS